ncbi:phage gateway protein [Entomohabitans teleogrylli]|uniref:phage gateway protein n=1 Tax=Entomohabitans teleogrylli TaxID=1384589 RepID=UPI00073D7A3E|nr:hypothetical protein [Entomohabitans teleogrylli]
MTDNDLFVLLRTCLLSEFELTGASVPDVQKISLQTSSDTPAVPTLYLHKTADVRTGFPGVHEEMDKVDQVMRETLTQVMIATLQITARVPGVDSNPGAITAQDLLKQTASTMQSRRFQASLIASGVNFLRVGTIKSADVADEYAGREVLPFFEFSLNYTDISVIEIPFVASTGLRIERI